jgi:hypothetical protein
MSTCPEPPFGMPQGDYAVDGFDDATLATLCCLEYGAPYLSTGFAILSKARCGSAAVDAGVPASVCAYACVWAEPFARCNCAAVCGAF